MKHTHIQFTQTQQKNKGITFQELKVFLATNKTELMFDVRQGSPLHFFARKSLSKYPYV